VDLVRRREKCEIYFLLMTLSAVTRLSDQCANVVVTGSGYDLKPAVGSSQIILWNVQFFFKMLYCLTSRFRRGLNKILGCSVALICSLLPTFRYNLPVSFSRSKQSKCWLTLNDKFPRKFCDYYYYYYYYLLQLGCHPVAVVILHVYKI